MLNHFVLLFNLVHHTLDCVLHKLSHLIHLYEFVLAKIHGLDHHVSVQTLIFTFASEPNVRFKLILFFIIFRRAITQLLNYVNTEFNEDFVK